MKKLKTFPIFLMLILIFAGVAAEAQRLSDPIVIGGTLADTASKRSSTVASWYSSDFTMPSYPGYYKFYLDIDTVGSVGKAKYKVIIQERPAGSTYYTTSTNTWGSSAGWTKGDTLWTITNQSTTTSPGLATKYYRAVVTPYDSTQKVRITGYLLKW